jgi:hypothetical protein
MLTSEVVVIQSMAAASEAFLRMASVLRQEPGVLRASSPVSMRAEERVAENRFRLGDGSGFRIEWYAEAEYEDGRQLSIALEVAWHDGWIVESSVRANTVSGEEVITDDAQPARTAAELMAEIERQTALLEGGLSQAVARLSAVDRG